MTALLSLIKRRLVTAWIWQCVAVLALLMIPISNYFTLQTAMQKMKFVAMDSRNTFYLSSIGSFETADKIHVEIAKMAVETIFSRNPDGFDNNERLERLFNPDTTKQLQAAAGKDAEIFKQQNIHQKIETGQIRELSVDNNTALVSVEGQILRTGMFNSKPVNDTKRVTVFLRLTLNESMSSNGRYPLVVTNVESRFE